jgi:WD40 repeat protein
MQFPGGKVVSSLDTGRSPTRFAVDLISQRIIVGFKEGGFGLVSLKDHKIDRYVGTGQSDGEVLELTFTADGRNVITTVDDKRALIYETENWEKVGFMNEHQSKIHAITVSPDGKKLATGDMTGKINVLEIPDQPVLK